MTPLYNTLSQSFRFVAILLVFAVLGDFKSWAQAESAKEDDYFKIMRIPTPEGAMMEVGGLCILPNGDLGVSTRRGDVFVVENPTSQRPFFRKFASGLHEALGLAYKDGALYSAQRGELTKLVDTNNDGEADLYETVYSWPVSGNYHEYSFGPKLGSDGSFFVTLNLGFFNDWWHPKSIVPWRGWALKIFEDGRMEPWAAGLRSPAGISMIDDELFYTDNQGDWVGSGSIIQLKKGAFAGHPASLKWANMPNSPIRLQPDDVYARINPRVEFDKNGKHEQPRNNVNDKLTTAYEMKKHFPELQIPAVWLPHGILGISNSEIVKIPKGTFGPFEGQLLVGDQGQSMISRVFMEKINGEYQGVAWPFRSGFQSGIVRMAWAKDGSLIAGETSRGWGSAGEASEGLQRLVWNGQLPFEMRTVKAMPDGFEIEFTKPVNKKFAEDLASYEVESFIYRYHAVYGSPPVDKKACPVKGVKVSADGMKARIIVGNLRPHYIHSINLEGLRDTESSFSLVHPTAYYTLNNIPEGSKLSLTDVSTRNSSSGKSAVAQAKKPVIKSNPAKAESDNPEAASPATKKVTSVSVKDPITFASVKPLLQKYTCLACHNATTRQVGPAYVEVAKRKYSVDEIVELIHNPKPENWPDFATPMPPMPNVPKADAQKIARYIKSLEKK
jgi:cytochrome c551/c552